jgi:amidase
VGPTGIDGESCLDPSSLQGFAQVPGFLARSVADLELALAATEGPDGRDVLCAPVPRSVGDVDLSSLVIGIGDGSNIGPVGDDVRAAIESLAADLAKVGLRVQRLPAIFGDCREAYDALRTFDDLAGLRALAAGREDLLTSAVRATLAPRPDHGAGLAGAAAPAGPEASATTARAAAIAHGAAHALAWERAIAARAAGLAQLAVTPLIVLPVAAGTEVGHDETLVVNGTTLRGFGLMAHCRAVSLLGAPAVSIPVDRTRRGLPLSVQIVGPSWADHLVLALARRLELLRGGFQPAPVSALPGTNQKVN